MDVFNTHGAFSWLELTTTDPDAAMAFYGKLFGWEFQKMEMETGPYTTIQVGDTSIGGIMLTPPQAEGSPPQWGAYVTVSDIDAVAAAVSEAGGTILAPPFSVPTVGRIMVIRDPQGAVLQAIQYDMPES